MDKTEESSELLITRSNDFLQIKHSAGLASISLYLFEFPVLSVLLFALPIRVFLAEEFSWVMMVFAISLSSIFAYVMYKEKYLSNLFKRLP
ncbi:MAG: hypothetical protein MK212_06470 [Saprospiraceae bacterium]|nr:hypothetical protein [Saprospiraceae bacterium]